MTEELVYSTDLWFDLELIWPNGETRFITGFPYRQLAEQQAEAGRRYLAELGVPLRVEVVDARPS